jgi:hypothetical protein
VQASTSTDGRVISINRAGQRILGIGEDVSHTDVGDYHPEWARGMGVDQGIPAAVRDGPRC